jgi:hypothetical protein
MSFIHNRPSGGLILGACLLFTTVALRAVETTPARFAGTYASRSGNGKKPGPSMEVSLGMDGTATVTEDAGNGAITHFGHWAESARQLKVSFDAVDGKPAEPPMTLQPEHDGLRAITWNHAIWGRTAPPTLKSRSRVKQRLTDKNPAE